MLTISSVSGEGLEVLKETLWKLVHEIRATAPTPDGWSQDDWKDPDTNAGPDSEPDDH